MNKHLILSGTTLAISLVLGCSGAIAGEQQKDTAMRKLQKTFPNMRVDALNESPLKGLYEITAGDQIFYFSGDTGHLFIGEIYSPEGVSLTGEKRMKLMQDKEAKIPLANAVKIGSGHKKVIVFVDPDDSFSREISKMLAERSDVTRYVFIAPMPQLNPDSQKKSEFILSSKDKAGAFQDVLSGKYDGKEPPPGNDAAKEMIKANQDLVKRLGLKGLPSLWVDGYFVKGSNIPLVTSILDGRKEAGRQ